MKIALFHNLPEGGAKRVFLELISEIEKLGNHVTLYTNKEGYTSSKFKFNKANIEVIKLNWLTPKNTKQYLKLIHTSYLSKIKELSNKIDKLQFDHVLIGGDWLVNTPPLSLFLKTPNIYLIHELKREFYQKTKISFFAQFKESFWKILTYKLKRWEIKSLNHSNQIIVNSILSLKLFNKILKKNSKIKIIHPFISNNFLKKTKQRKKGNYWLMIGNDYYLKGFDFILNSISRNPLFSNINLKIVTTTKIKHNIQKNILPKSKINIKILTLIKDTKLIELYQNASLLLYFPRNEPFGLTPIEALSFKCPVLAINEGGFTEISYESLNMTLIPRNKRILIKKLVEFIEQEDTGIYKDINFTNKIKNKFNINSYTKKLLYTIKETK